MVGVECDGQRTMDMEVNMYTWLTVMITTCWVYEQLHGVYAHMDIIDSTNEAFDYIERLVGR